MPILSQPPPPLPATTATTSTTKLPATIPAEPHPSHWSDAATAVYRNWNDPTSAPPLLTISDTSPSKCRPLFHLACVLFVTSFLRSLLLLRPSASLAYHRPAQNFTRKTFPAHSTAGFERWRRSCAYFYPLNLALYPFPSRNAETDRPQAQVDGGERGDGGVCRLSRSSFP